MPTAKGNRTSLLGISYWLVASIAVAALGVLGVLYFVDRVHHNIELNAVRATWPTVQGSVLSASIPRGWRTEVGDPEYGNINIKFAYEVTGQRYSGAQVLPESPESSGWCGWTCDDEKKELELKYAPGATVTARYNPSNPGEASIRPYGWPVGWLLLAIISGLAVPGVAIKFFIRLRQGYQKAIIDNRCGESRLVPIATGQRRRLTGEGNIGVATIRGGARRWRREERERRLHMSGQASAASGVGTLATAGLLASNFLFNKGLDASLSRRVPGLLRLLSLRNLDMELRSRRRVLRFC